MAFGENNIGGFFFVECHSYRVPGAPNRARLSCGRSHNTEERKECLHSQQMPSHKQPREGERAKKAAAAAADDVRKKDLQFCVCTGSLGSGVGF